MAAVIGVLCITLMTLERTAAHETVQEDNDGGFVITMRANVTGPARDAVFHTGAGSNSIPIDYAASMDATVDPPEGGAGMATEWRVNHTLFLAPSTHLAGASSALAPDTNLVFEANDSEPKSYTRCLSKQRDTARGGHTAVADAWPEEVLTGNFDSHTHQDQHSFSVIE